MKPARASLNPQNRVWRYPKQTSKTENKIIYPRQEFGQLVAANRILARENNVDAFGHVSIRNPDDKNHFVMSRSRAPELVEFDDLMEFELDGDRQQQRAHLVWMRQKMDGRNQFGFTFVESDNSPLFELLG